MKTVIHVWTHTLCNLTSTPLDNRFGLGDLIRGSIGALQYCEKRGYTCILDISLHPLSQIFVPVEHPYSDLIKRNSGNINGLFENVEHVLDEKLETRDVVFFFSNFTPDVYNNQRTSFVVTNIHRLLTLRPEFASYVDGMMGKIPYPSFSVLHFRLGDEDVINGNPGQYDAHIDTLKRVLGPNQILLSDSSHFKSLVKDLIFTFNEPVSHVGFHSDINKIRHTLFEFILLTRATEIHTFSVYSWTSGFVKSANYLYNVQVSPIR
jgi:hypothetical protein